jgi:hypothetical protein
LIVLSIFLIVLYDRYNSLIALIVEGFVIGMAVMTHHRACVVLVIAVVQQVRTPGWLGRILILVGMSIVVWFTTVAVHLTVLPFASEGEYAPSSVASTLVADQNPNWASRIEKPSLFVRVTALTFSKGNQSLTEPSDFEWVRWPLTLSRCEVLYNVEHRKIVYFGNPLVWVLVAGAVVATIVEVAMTANIARIEGVFAAGYVLGLLVRGEPPDLCVSLMFGLILVVRWIERVPSTFRGFVASVVIGGALFGFYLWAALAYGFYVADFAFLDWNGRWLGT